ncbi:MULTISPECIES: hypothetical protein [unclassified Psychrobacter]|uniref:hypothetical protein n=1 Tax=unclassified Psychrobacter TaxID=196806 RepID=UPI0018670B52|nr:MULTISPECIES: hypothetical protein [unclassified Psychrobacter]
MNLSFTNKSIPSTSLVYLATVNSLASPNKRTILAAPTGHSPMALMASLLKSATILATP